MGKLLQIPAPRVLTPDELATLRDKLLRNELTQDDQFDMMHFILILGFVNKRLAIELQHGLHYSEVKLQQRMFDLMQAAREDIEQDLAAQARAALDAVLEKTTDASE